MSDDAAMSNRRRATATPSRTSPTSARATASARSARTLGVTAFGVNAIVIPPSYETGRHLHEKQEELYFLHSGRIAIEFGDGTEPRARARRLRLGRCPDRAQGPQPERLRGRRLRRRRRQGRLRRPRRRAAPRRGSRFGATPSWRLAGSGRKPGSSSSVELMSPARSALALWSRGYRRAGDDRISRLSARGRRRHLTFANGFYARARLLALSPTTTRRSDRAAKPSRDDGSLPRHARAAERRPKGEARGSRLRTLAKAVPKLASELEAATYRVGELEQPTSSTGGWPETRFD